MNGFSYFLAGVLLAAAAGTAVFIRRVRQLNLRAVKIIDAARHYRDGDLTPPRVDYGEDALGRVAREMDGSIQELGRRLAELARDRGRVAAILDGMIEGVIVVDPQGRVQLVNNAAREMFRIDDLAIGRPYIETIRHPAAIDMLGAALRGETSEATELSPPRQPARILTARAAPRGDDGRHGAVLVLYDITELRRGDQVRRDFVANVSHELRTPLTAIRGYLEALAEGDATPEEARHFVEVTQRHAHNMERLVKDLLRLARLDAGQEILEFGACDTRAMLHSVAADLSPLIEQRQQRVHIAVDPEAAVVRADAAKLHDVLRNLLINASTYAPEQTSIHVDARPDGDRVVISVADQGPGIPEEDLPRIFERFYRVDKSRGRDPGGTGLGLAIVKHLVELHGGTIEVENRTQGGAAFRMTLPRPVPVAAGEGSARAR